MSALHVKLEILFQVDFIVTFVTLCQGINLVLVSHHEKRLFPAVRYAASRAERPQVFTTQWDLQVLEVQVILLYVSQNEKGKLHFRITVSGQTSIQYRGGRRQVKQEVMISSSLMKACLVSPLPHFSFSLQLLFSSSLAVRSKPLV